MKKVNLELIDLEIVFYYGEKEYKTFLNRCREIGADLEELNKYIKDFENSPEGLHVANYLWVKDKTDLPIIVHELTHVIDVLFSDLGAEDELEFRAYTTEFVFRKILEYVS